MGTPYLFLPLITEAVQLQSPQHDLEVTMLLFTGSLKMELFLTYQPLEHTRSLETNPQIAFVPL